MRPIPHPEHPRPDLEREPWHNLNGPWDLALDDSDRGLAEEWWQRPGFDRQVTVPYPIGSELSGAQEIPGPRGVYWYLRRFDLPATMHDRCLRLHFGAADYHARVWLNGVLLGDHVGGYTPFSFDITEVVRARDNRLVVRVADSRSLRQVRGKQTWRARPFSVFYPGTSGLWQTVWLEAAGPSYLKDIRLSPDLEQGCFHLRAAVERPEAAHALDVYVTLPGTWHPSTRLRVAGGRVSGAIPLVEARPWSPQAPHLYQFELVLRTAGEAELDRVRTYAGLRTIATEGGQILLNGRPLYQRLVLAQGYFPGGAYTPVGDEAWRADVELAAAMGFNGLRLHQKLEAPRLLYWCDRLGVLVWSELPSAYWPGRESRAQIARMLPEMVARDGNHPAIIAWVLFNESWGTHDLAWSASAQREVVQLVNQARNLDPSRLVIDNSGFDHLETDVVDIHHYLEPAAAEAVYDDLLSGRLWHHAFLPGLRYIVQPQRAFKPPLGPGVAYQGQPMLVSEYGGLGHYHEVPEGGLLEAYRAATEAIARRPGFQGYCYTQMYDTYQEHDGLLTFDRQPKVPLEALRAFNERLNSAQAR